MLKLRPILFICAIGVALIYFGITDIRNVRTTPPQGTSLDHMLRNGVERGAYVAIYDFSARTDAFVYTDKGSGTPWTTVYVPLIVRDSVPQTASPSPGAQANPSALRGTALSADQPVAGAPADLRVLLRSRRIHDPVQMADLAAQGSVRGILEYSYSSLGSEERRLLARAYPGCDVGRLLVLDEGGAPTVFRGAGMIGGGICAILLSAWMLKALFFE